MASEPFEADELNLIEQRRWGDNSKVYTRKSKGKRNNNNNSAAAAATASTTTTSEPAPVVNDDDKDKGNETPKISNGDLQELSMQTLADPDGSSLQQEKSLEALPPPSPREEESAVEEHNPLEQLNGGASISQVLPESREHVVPPQPSGNAAPEEPELELRPLLITRVEDRIRINIPGAMSRDEINELRMKLEGEVDQVRTLYKKVEGKELQLTAFNSSINSNTRMVNDSFGGAVNNFGGYGHGQPQYMANEVVERRRGLTRVNSEVGPVGYQGMRPFSRSLSVSVVNHDRGVGGVGEYVEREKRTPKANQFYRNSEFLLGKDRLPPESNKKLKFNNGAGRKHGGEVPRGVGFSFDKHRERVFRSCSNLLQRLMKHQHGWVFNEPVDVNELKLHDYHDIIKNPMDLGSIKTRLVRNYYKSPREFAEDVRLVFRNAMTYNPPGQDVHVMAETLLKIFEERWAVIEVEYNPDWRHQMYHDAGLPTPTPRIAPATQFYTPGVPALAPAPAPFTPAPFANPVTPAPQARTLDRLESMATTTPSDPRLVPYVGRTPALKKPKARDPNKRNMTYDEKQKLGMKLQNLPAEKLDNIVQIINKRNSSLSQNGDEIEIDIDSVDTETLWELDRFVTNYKKNLSKNKRKAEVALQAQAEPVPVMIPVTNPAPVIVDAQNDKRIIIGESNAPAPALAPAPAPGPAVAPVVAPAVAPAVAPVETENGRDNASRSSSSSSSSSSDSGSSSSDSDSDSSSSGSDTPKT